MRAVNTVIQAAGNNRAADPDGVEDLLVLSALADSNRPKFLAEDMLLFNAILGAYSIINMHMYIYTCICIYICISIYSSCSPALAYSNR